MSAIAIEDTTSMLLQNDLVRMENQQETTERLLIMALIFVVSLTGTSVCLADSSLCRRYS